MIFGISLSKSQKCPLGRLGWFLQLSDNEGPLYVQFPCGRLKIVDGELAKFTNEELRVALQVVSLRAVCNLRSDAASMVHEFAR